MSDGSQHLARSLEIGTPGLYTVNWDYNDGTRATY